MQYILGTPNDLTMASRALEVALLFSFVTVLLGLPTTPVPELEDRTLSTELQPPSSDGKERHAIVYIINLYAVKNGSSSVSEEMFENEVVEAIPDILEPLATVLLIVEDEEEKNEKQSPADLDEFARGLESQGFKVDKINRYGKTKALRMNLEETEAQSMIDSARKPVHEKQIDEKSIRRKRTICLKCGGGGGYGGGYYPGGGGGGGCPTCGGGGGGGYYPPSGGGGGYYPPSGGGYRKAVIPVVVVPIGITGGHHGGHRGGGGRPHYPSGGGGGGGGGCYTCGGGGSGSYAQAQASAQASSGSWGK